MIGFVLRGMGIGGGDGGCIVGIIIAITALCALFGLYQCCSCRMRDCICCRKLLLKIGADTFDDFQVTFLVHEALYQMSKGKAETIIRLTASDQKVETDPNNKGIFQQALELNIPQGTESIDVELYSPSEKKVLAVLKLDPDKDILHMKEPCMEKIFNMRQKSKGVLNPRVKLTIHKSQDADLEKSILSEFDENRMSDKTKLMLSAQLNKVKDDEADADGDGVTTSLELLVAACSGPLDKFGSWGARDSVFVAIRGPPESRKYVLSIYANERDFEQGKKPDDQVELLKILSVQADPARPEVFIIHYVGTDKVKQRLTFRRTDRARDVWVEMLHMLITTVREEKTARSKNKKH